MRLKERRKGRPDSNIWLLFRYTDFLRATGATVSAGALHAQGWGFESLVAHHRSGTAPREGPFPCRGSLQGIRTPWGAQLRKRRSRFPAKLARGRRPRSGRSRREPRTDIPRRPPQVRHGPSRGAVSMPRLPAGDSNPLGRAAEETAEPFPSEAREGPFPCRGPETRFNAPIWIFFARVVKELSGARLGMSAPVFRPPCMLRCIQLFDSYSCTSLMGRWNGA